MNKPFAGDFPQTQGFGEHPELYKQFLVKQPDGSLAPMKGHNGQDWGLPTGTPVLSPIDGKVLEATLDPTGYGNYVKIENDKEGVVLAHFQKFTVSVGFVVKTGDQVGISNNTGNSTGPHLHMGYYTIPRDRSNGYGGFIDPSPYLVEVKTYSEAEYTAAMLDRKKFWEERDKALEDNAALNKELKRVSANYTGIAALGITTADDLKNERIKRETENEGLLRENVQLRDSCTKTHELAAAEGTIEANALKKALAIIEERNKLQAENTAIKTVVGASAKIEFPQFIDYLHTITKLVEDYFSKTKKPGFAPGILAPAIDTKKDTFWDDLLKITGFALFFLVILAGSMFYFAR